MRGEDTKRERMIIMSSRRSSSTTITTNEGFHSQLMRRSGERSAGDCVGIRER